MVVVLIVQAGYHAVKLEFRPKMGLFSANNMETLFSSGKLALLLLLGITTNKEIDEHF